MSWQSTFGQKFEGAGTVFCDQSAESFRFRIFESPVLNVNKNSYSPNVIPVIRPAEKTQALTLSSVPVQVATQFAQITKEDWT
jgi:hypothetical protein